MLETDAQEVCRQLNASNIPNTTLLGRIYDDVWAKLSLQLAWKVVHVNRRGNNVAHILAAYACSLEQDEFYFSTPSMIQASIVADLCTT